MASFFCGLKRSIQRLAYNERGFTMAEMAVTVVILGILVGVAAITLRPSQSTELKAAGLQVERALSEAYSIAQNEKVVVNLVFYGNSNEPAIRNSYEISRGTTSMKPPVGVKYFASDESGTMHYYCRFNAGGQQPKISGLKVSMAFVSRGASTRCEEADGSGTPVTKTIILQYDGLPDRSITVNPEGRVTIL